MPPRFARGNRDKNEPLITEVLRRMNVEYVLLPEGAGADILLYLSPLALVEVKNPNVPKSDQKLTKRELEVQAFCSVMKIPYHVVLMPEEMAQIVKDWIERSDYERRKQQL